MNVRKGKTVAKVEQYKPGSGYEELAGRLISMEVKEYPSINLAKKANGLNATVMQHGEKLPPTVEAAIAAARATS